MKDAVIGYRSGLDEGPVLPEASTQELQRRIQDEFAFDARTGTEGVVEKVATLLKTGAVHTTHPCYFGLFNPDVHPICVAADALSAAFNPQMAAFSHNPAANLMEQHALSVFRRAIGWPDCHATFTAGGSEANHSAIIVALTDRLSGYRDSGVSSRSRLYVSAEAHHSFVKIAHACGIGRSGVREIGVSRDLRMDVYALREAIREDIREGYKPFAAVATAGTTAAGAIDPIGEMAEVCRKFGLWLHVDAAWGGAALLSRNLKPLFAGIELADSVIIDAHKWLSVPMGAGMFFCRNPEANQAAFGIQTSYMPPATDLPDPYHSTLQWSRRFTGLKVFMAFAALGLEGFEQVIDHQSAMGEYLRDRARDAGYQIVNDTKLPLVCFRVPGRSATEVVESAYATRQAWVSKTTLSHHGDAVRACITNFRTQPKDVDRLMAAIESA